MAEWSRFRRARLGRCPHTEMLRTVNAGLERLVCETCGAVSVRFISETVKVFNDPPDPPARRRPVCGSCNKLASFLVPSGFACGGHAWEAASRQDEIGAELWIPIKIDQTSNAPG